jgi:hypothetical protein
MDQELLRSAVGAGPTAAVGGGVQKRNRVLLSCAPCRMSKLKCDRLQPCTQCAKKARPEGCLYAPKPEKNRPAKSMAARLKRLEGMVRTMMDNPEAVGGSTVTSAPTKEVVEVVEVVEEVEEGVGLNAQVVRHAEKATYVGATHFMAVLEDVSVRPAGHPASSSSACVFCSLGRRGKRHLLLQWLIVRDLD